MVDCYVKNKYRYDATVSGAAVAKEADAKETAPKEAVAARKATAAEIEA